MLVLNSNSAYTGDKKDLPGYWPTFGYTPTVALSLRQLSASYTGPAIRVRRSSDNTVDWPHESPDSWYHLN